MQNINEWWNRIADEGKAITVKRKQLGARGVFLPACRVEILIKLDRIIKFFHSH